MTYSCSKLSKPLLDILRMGICASEILCIMMFGHKKLVALLFQCAKDTRNQPDNVLQFIKTHPLMDTAVRQKKGCPMFHQGNIIFRNIAIDVVREYKVFFLGTSTCILHLRHCITLYFCL